MSGNLVESLIGAIVLLAAGAFIVFTYNITDAGAVDGYVLTARFERIDGLAVGSDVRLSGIKVGTVVGQELDPKTYQALLKISVDSAIQLPVDTVAVITSEGLLGGSYLALKPGGFDEYLVEGDEIEFTQGSIDLMSLIGQAIFSVTGDESKENAGQQ